MTSEGKRLIVVQGMHESSASAKTVTLRFLACDFVTASSATIVGINKVPIISGPLSD
jgi:hypothetical protein